MPTLRKYLTITVCCIVVAALFVTFYVGAGNDNETLFMRKVVLEAVTPLQNLIGKTFGAVGETWERYVFLVGIKEENGRLKARISGLERELNQAREVTLECRRLRKLLGLKEQIDSPTIAARVIGRERASLFKSFVVDRGATDGLKVGYPVVADDGVVGKIIEVSWNTAKVLLIVDYNSRIDAFVQRQRVRGILEGKDGTCCILKYVPRTQDVSAGDVIVSSGLAGGFPKGLLLGRVTKVRKSEADLFQEIEVMPAVDVEEIEEVVIIISESEGAK